MTYEETLEWLFSQTAVFERDGAKAYKPGLETISALCRSLGNPHEKLRCIHIAGTNGKGSTASTLAAIFRCAGMKTALFTSPHLVDFRERIRVNGEMIPREEVVSFTQNFIESDSGLHPSFFELTTAMAFDWFARQRVDIAIIEVGLGGRLDSTNIITPLLSIITNISLDHTSLLGSTPEAIAAEKAGIIKPGIPVVIGEANDPKVREVFLSKAPEAVFASAVEAEELPDGTWSYPAYGIHGALRGAFQPANAATVLAAMKFFPEVPPEAVRLGFERVEELTGLRGRLTRIGNLTYDTGHNPGAWAYLSEELRRMPRPLTAVIGFAADKDVRTILSRMPADAYYIFTCPSSKRGLPAAELRTLAPQLRGEVIEDVKEAVARARALTPTSGSIFVGGSNFVIADFLA